MPTPNEQESASDEEMEQPGEPDEGEEAPASHAAQALQQRRKGKAKVSDAEPAEPLADTVQGSVPADGDDRAEEQEQEPLFEDLLSDYKAEEALITSTKRSRRKKRRQRRCGKGGEGAAST